MKLIAISLCLLLSGCSGLAFWRHAAPAPAVRVETPGGPSVSLSGAAKTPPKVEAGVARTTVPLPAGSMIKFDSHLGTYVLTLPAASQIETTTTSTKVDGPTSFEPPQPPTQAEISTEHRKGLFYVLGFLGVASAIFGLVEGWHLLMVGGFVVAGAAVVAITFNQYPWIMLVISGAGGFAVAGPYVWHILGFKKLQPTIASIAAPKS